MIINQSVAVPKDRNTWALRWHQQNTFWLVYLRKSAKCEEECNMLIDTSEGVVLYLQDDHDKPHDELTSAVAKAPKRSQQ